MTGRRRGRAPVVLLGLLLGLLLGPVVAAPPGTTGRSPGCSRHGCPGAGHEAEPPRLVRPFDAAPAIAPTAQPVPDPARPDCARLRCVALTFDDGPSDVTPRLLDTLATERVRATFFVVGQEVAARPALVRRELAEGHAVGNHTYDHTQLTKLDAERVNQEIDQGADAVERATGVRPELLRPPYGAFSATVRRTGHPLVLWDVDSLDWRDDDAAGTARRGVTLARPGSVILMHDTVSSTPDALPELIDGLRARGFTLVTVPQLFGTLEAGRDYPRLPAAPAPVPHPGAVTWRYRPADGPDTEAVLADPRPGRCYPGDRPGFALRDETDHDVESYRNADCTDPAGLLHPGDEVYDELGGFVVRDG
ncbi:polysaccharide deacetylase family protein [Kitasatospora sp. NPDC052896]|uniref:polysaccharide deacetylase family protein n=1 Tax=Kitasatospora sp. NPDC052896 TaxID=3364061 RepID=UPI0037C8A879